MVPTREWNHFLAFFVDVRSYDVSISTFSKFVYAFIYAFWQCSEDDPIEYLASAAKLSFKSRWAFSEFGSHICLKAEDRPCDLCSSLAAVR